MKIITITKRTPKEDKELERLREKAKHKPQTDKEANRELFHAYPVACQFGFPHRRL